VATRLELVNQVLSLIGEQPEVSTNSNVGRLVATVLQTAINHVAGLTRHSIFESLVDINVTNPDWLVPIYTLPDTNYQIYSVFAVIDTGLTTGDNLIKLPSSSFQNCIRQPSYSVVGNNVYLSLTVSRPCDIKLHLLSSYVLPGSDGTTVALPDNVLDVVKHYAASILAASYLDDANQASIQQNISENLAAQIRSQLGATRGKTYNMGGR
jgi:hypothetical protein